MVAIEINVVELPDCPKANVVRDGFILQIADKKLCCPRIVAHPAADARNEWPLFAWIGYSGILDRRRQYLNGLLAERRIKVLQGT